MVKLGPVLLVAACCLAAIQALLDSKNGEEKNHGLEEIQKKCTPGKFYKRGCKRCFCDDKRRPVCGGTDDCKSVNKYPNKPSFLRTYSYSELQKLPSLVHQSLNCTPGRTYRVDCDACICLANKNLMCNDLLCPSYEDINRIAAKQLTGKTCTQGKPKNQDCTTCSCDEGVYNCKAEPNCIPTDGRRGGAIQPSDLNCTKGMVYKRGCNRCYCVEENRLRCTLMRCLKHTEVQRLKKLREKLDREGL